MILITQISYFILLIKIPDKDLLQHFVALPEYLKTVLFFALFKMQMLSDPHLVHSLRRLPLHHSRPRCEPFLGEFKKKKKGNLGMACHHSIITAMPPLLSQSENINYLRSQGWNQDEEKLCCLKFYRTSKKMRKFWVCMKHCMKWKKRK